MMTKGGFSIFSQGQQDNKLINNLIAGQGLLAGQRRPKSGARRPGSAGHNGPTRHGSAKSKGYMMPANHDPGTGPFLTLSKEDLIVEINEMKKRMFRLEENASHIKAENQRLETEATKQQRRIDQLLNLHEGAKNMGLSADIRRDIEKSILVRQLKMQINSLRTTLSEKENDLEGMKRNTKTSRFLEIEAERDEYYMETLRLRNIISDLKEELRREKAMREKGVSYPTDNGDELKKEVARLSSGYQDMLTNLSHRPSRPSSSSGARSKPISETEKLKRPQSAGATRGSRLGNMDPDVQGDQQFNMPDDNFVMSYGRPVESPVFDDPLDNFGIPEIASQTGGTTSRGVELATLLNNEDPLLGTATSPFATLAESQKLQTPAGSSKFMGNQLEENGTIASKGDFDGDIMTNDQNVQSTSNSPYNGGAGEKLETVFQVGERVQGKFQNGEVWYDATVKGVTPEELYHLLYDDGDEEKKVPLSLIRSLDAAGIAEAAAALGDVQPQQISIAAKFNVEAKFKVGEVVEAQYYQGETWYRGKIENLQMNQEKGKFMYDILYDDGDREKGVIEDKVRLIPTAQPTKNEPESTEIRMFKAGDKVEGFFEEYSAWYMGLVMGDNKNGTYHVLYDDGDEEKAVPAARLKKVAAAIINAPKKENIPLYDIGEKVQGLFNGKPQWLDAEVLRSKPSARDPKVFVYDLLYESGAKEFSVQDGNIRKKPEPLSKKTISDLSDTYQEKSKYNVGDRVEGLFGGLTEWYPAVIKEIKSIVAGEEKVYVYALEYDDGDTEDAVDEANVRILEKKEDKIIEPTKKVPEPEVEVEPEEEKKIMKKSKFQVGNKVEGLYQGMTNWYKAVVDAVYPTDDDEFLYDLTYEDGDKETKIEEKYVRVLETFISQKQTKEEDNGVKETINTEPVPLITGDNPKPITRASTGTVTTTNLDNFLDELSDDEEVPTGGGLDLNGGRVVTLKAGQEPPAHNIQRDEEEEDVDYEEDFDA